MNNSNWTESDIERAIIGVSKRNFTPLRPNAVTHISLQRQLTGITQKNREERYEKIKLTTAKTVKTALQEALEKGFLNSSICTVASREKIEAANTEQALYEFKIRAFQSENHQFQNK